MEIIYRKLQAGETELYREIRLESLKTAPNAFGASYEEEAAVGRLRFETFISLQLPDKFMMAAFDGEQIIGLCGFIREEQKKSSHRGIIIQMYVKPSYSGKGIGKVLLQQTVNDAFGLDGLEMITLGVVPDNIAAVKIYGNVGFKKYGTLENYLKNGHNYNHQDFMVLHKQ